MRGRFEQKERGFYALSEQTQNENQGKRKPSKPLLGLDLPYLSEKSLELWCRRRDSNPHTLAGTWT